MIDFLQTAPIRRVVNLRLPRFEQLPALDLYMDQVISVVNTALRPLFSPDEPILTPTMVGNYVKLKLVPPPVKKRYSREHLAYIMAIVLLKQVYSISEIGTLVQRQMQTVGAREAYDYFCDQFEQALVEIFGEKNQFAPSDRDEKLELICFVVSSIAHKIFVQRYLDYRKAQGEAAASTSEECQES